MEFGRDRVLPSPVRENVMFRQERHGRAGGVGGPFSGIAMRKTFSPTHESMAGAFPASTGFFLDGKERRGI